MSSASDLDVDVQEKFERGWGLVEKGFFVLFLIFILCGVAGVFGGGPLSRVHTQMPGAPIRVAYDRFTRDRGQTDLTIDVVQPIASNVLWLGVDKTFLAHNKISASTPAAMLVQASADGVQYGFRLGPNHRGRVVISLEPQEMGPAHGALSYGAAHLILNQIVYP